MQYEALLSQLTTEEKVQLCHAQDKFSIASIPRLGIASLVTSDGPNGIREEQAEDEWRGLGRQEDHATYLSAETVLAATWNPELCRQQGRVLAQEALYRGKDVVLAPGINIIRTPLGGRNFEYFSEDPFFTATMAVPYIQGIQENDVGACVKHYALNNQETNRGDINITVSRRALFEIYLHAFEAAVQQADVACVMGAYNRFEWQHCCHNRYLVNEILKKKWNFQGVFMSDWAGTKDTAEALFNGLDLEMGSELGSHNNDHMADPLLTMLKKNPDLINLVDDKVRRFLRLHDKLKIGSPQRRQGSFNTPQHQLHAYQVAAEGIILLKNEGILPIRDTASRILVTGPNAQKQQSNGGGSSAISAFYEITPLDGIRVRFPEAEVQYIQSGNIVQLKKAASNVDWVIYCGGLNHDLGYDCEGADRTDLKLPGNQDMEIATLLQVNPHTIVVLTCGTPVEMPWIDQAGAVLWTGYAGMEGGNALADILRGSVNPSGKLPYTMPRHLGDHPCERYGGYSPDDNHYLDDIFVGYRGYDRDQIQPLFCFGHGLHYGQLRYESLRCYQHDNQLHVFFSITNLADMAVSEAAQVYIGHPDNLSDRPPKELKAFQKIPLKSGETCQVQLQIGFDELAIYDDSTDGFRFFPGVYRVYVGASSRDLPLSCQILLADPSNL